MDAEKTIDSIFKYLCENIPKLEGRSYKKYAKELEKMRNDVSIIICTHRACRDNLEIDKEQEK